MKRNIYLKTIPVSEALNRMKTVLMREELVGKEVVPSHEAAGRVTAGPLFARHSSPAFHGSAMDGYAVKADTTFAAREGSPVRLAKGRDCHLVNTGNPLPEGMDAVVMIEHVLREDEEGIEIEAPVFPWRHVRRAGEDIVATELLIPRNRQLTPYDVGALLSAGIWEVEVWERVRIRFIPTGDEILDFRHQPEPGPGQSVDSNSQVLASLARNWGCEVLAVPPVADDPETIGRALDEGLKSNAHIVVIGAGSSAGSKDYARSVIERAGEVLVHGLAVMPGKPSILGVAQGKPVVGAPGYPVSAVVCFEEVVGPLASWLGGTALSPKPSVDVELARDVPSKLGIEELVRLAVGRVRDKYIGAPLGRGAGMITSLTRAQAIARIPAEREGVEEGATLKAELLVPEAELDRTLIVAGSHDNTLDLLADMLMAGEPPIRLVAVSAGSMGGLTALKSGSALVAAAHLFDPESGDFNFPFLKRYLPGREVAVINVALRHQGLITARGNPLGLKGLGDLARKDVQFVNRQRGSGTRILLDHHLKQQGISPENIEGYGREEYTHMAVAVNVKTGSADCGLGIRAAAQALELDFVPLARERYDLIVPAESDDSRVARLLEVVRSPGFREAVESLGGYETHLTGNVMQPGMGLGT